MRMALCRAPGISLILKKTFSTSGLRGYSVEVMVSQSSNPMANLALEEWIRRSASFKHRNLLLLSSNQVEKGRNIKAFFLGEMGDPGSSKDYLREQANLVFNSIPRDAALSKMPEVQVQDEDGSVMISVPLVHPDESTIASTLQSIADNILEQGPQDVASRVSLVRPDGGWFPGIQHILHDMEVSLNEIEAIKRDKKLSHAEQKGGPRHNSFGGYF